MGRKPSYLAGGNVKIHHTQTCKRKKEQNTMWDDEYIN